MDSSVKYCQEVEGDESEKYSLDLMTRWSLGVLASAASDGEKNQSWP